MTIFLADRWGQVYLSADAAGGQWLPESGSELIRVLTRMSIRYPEYRVLDVP